MTYQAHSNLIDEPPSIASATGLDDSSPRCYDNFNDRLQAISSQDSLAIKYKRMKCAVIVMATLMIIASMLLVGVSLAMAEHIDELVRQMNGMGTTRRLVAATTTTRSTTTTTTTPTTTMTMTSSASSNNDHMKAGDGV